ncbi:uncharacterized protein LOC121855426 [Homarus americanus]|uniref:uncharacterized protein LOC121855426 n=1 Tax=Homarus americanus TaxID=6706 RepID=UPI001C45402F|nr:uncharacterized protein LOC121855426 [Homarus americanus]
MLKSRICSVVSVLPAVGVHGTPEGVQKLSKGGVHRPSKSTQRLYLQGAHDNRNAHHRSGGRVHKGAHGLFSGCTRQQKRTSGGSVHRDAGRLHHSSALCQLYVLRGTCCVGWRCLSTPSPERRLLSCSYDLRATRLYSLKWYHNGTEFYRYVPTERNAPINIQPTHKFSVTEVSRDERRVTVSLTKLRVSASGQYRCEVIAEHPSFRTEFAAANMTVLSEYSEP